ncbi:MAG: MerR family transcriptional regulator [Alphaproteobacteria bacterium]|nr:MerR family transcriptional regulator [Alphaproteobacteria bacterium]MCL2889658.1 MerR family transcriptional regulator [Alphaproteobacteria bacterium]
MNEPFVSINELSKRLGVPAHTLRYWEKAFGGAVRPTTGAGGRRYYRDEDVQKITMIQDLLYNQKYTIAGVKKLLNDGVIPQSRKAASAGPGQNQAVENIFDGKHLDATKCNKVPHNFVSQNLRDDTQINAALDLLRLARAEISE